MRYSGLVGFTTQQETSPGVWTDVITEKQYFGDFTQANRRLVTQGGAYPEVNDDVVLTNIASIVADDFASVNFLDMRYAVWRGIKWKVESVEVKNPRLILTLGGQWNENAS